MSAIIAYNNMPCDKAAWTDRRIWLGLITFGSQK